MRKKYCDFCNNKFELTGFLSLHSDEPDTLGEYGVNIDNDVCFDCATELGEIIKKFKDKND